MLDMDNEEGSGLSDESEAIMIIISLAAIGAIVLISIIITAVTVSLCCWCYYSRKRKRDLLALKNSGRLVSDDLKVPGNESQSMINIANLDTKKVKYLCNNIIILS